MQKFLVAFKLFQFHCLTKFSHSLICFLSILQIMQRNKVFEVHIIYLKHQQYFVSVSLKHNEREHELCRIKNIIKQISCIQCMQMCILLSIYISQISSTNPYSAVFINLLEVLETSITFDKRFLK